MNNLSRDILSISNDYTAYRDLPIALPPTAQEWIIEGLKHRLGDSKSKFERY
jgi:hypothetical protein